MYLHSEGKGKARARISSEMDTDSAAQPGKALPSSGSQNDWDFEGFEDISHLPVPAPSEGMEPALKKPEALCSAKGRHKELSNAFGNSIPLPAPLPVFSLRGPPPVDTHQVLAARVPMLKHVPGAIRPRIQLAFASILRCLNVQKDLMSLWAVLAFPKFVLRGTGDPKNHPGKDASHVVADRLDKWEAGRFKEIWADITAEEKKACARRPQTRAASRVPKGTDLKIVESMRSLVAEGGQGKH